MKISLAVIPYLMALSCLSLLYNIKVLSLYCYVWCARKIEILSVKILEEQGEKKKGNFLGHDQQIEERTAARESTDACVLPA